MNEYSPIYKSYNGQEIQYELANYFCDLLYKRAANEPGIHSIEIIKHPHELRAVDSFHRGLNQPFYPTVNQSSGYELPGM